MITSEILSSTEAIARKYTSVRAQTSRLCNPLVTEDYVVQTDYVVSPPKWHLGHTAWLFENFILQRFLKGYTVFNERYHYVFNSYYLSAGKLFDKNVRGSVSRPTVEEVYQYRMYVDEHILNLIASLRPENQEEVIALIELGLHHEQQHQELMMYDIKHIFYHNPLQPIYQADPSIDGAMLEAPALTWAEWDSSLDTYGWQGHSFAYDNEGPSHKYYVPAFRLANRPVLNEEWLEFIEAGGYNDPRYWLDNGWKLKTAEGWEAPLYWEQTDGNWMLYTLSGLKPMPAAAPVCHISYYEADAFARWKGCRLPTEYEWEKAAKGRSIDGNFMEQGVYQPTSVTGEERLDKLYGDVWEWTGSAYLPYPGFRFINDGLGEYNGKFMNNQMVLRGGSCMTPISHIRPTYRNFYGPEHRWQMSGLRLADDL